jgi:hypothetical protein
LVFETKMRGSITKWIVKWPNVCVNAAFFGVLAITNVAEARNNSEPRRQEQQGSEAVIRFIRDPDPAPEFAVKGIDGGTVNLAAARHTN